ncbi:MULTISPECIES: histidine phosphatase family protein [unclassified Methanosarcina]|uniref:histidine phosphatase family protein n=1 Tax=unclassified Methanosarcina TaxID=2644672 RepID=UPI00061593FA|nr:MULTISPECIES: 2,3-diphosphoglycerate-dependent phosphoglycerate mutase [unclassified Methanosarcina]AKB19857.1 Phosphoglycerate mutase [Methanosarcina sp. WWM596]AKB22372.1 Phosphoglycerate mutase [Methanosarcina sp. WH1]
MNYLILVRHGESGWNVDGRFGGWVDVPLTEKGIEEALLCAAEFEKIRLDIAFTSKLVRAQETLFLILSKQAKIGVFVHEKENRYSYPPKIEKSLIPIYSSEALNERYYGILQGKKKEKMKEKYGEEQIFHWCRSYDEGPPEGESLKDIYRRVVPYFEREILPVFLEGKNVIVCAHQNSLRALIKHIERISNEDIRKIKLANARPVIYTLSGDRLVRENVEMDPAVKRNI